MGGGGLASRNGIVDHVFLINFKIRFLRLLAESDKDVKRVQLCEGCIHYWILAACLLIISARSHHIITSLLLLLFILSKIGEEN